MTRFCLGKNTSKKVKEGGRMAVEKVDTIVVGGGQAGIAMSEHLSICDIPHFVFERHRIAERWRSERWDSLVMNGPAWHDRFPGMEFSSTHPDSFPNKDMVVAYLEAYAKKIAAPIRCGVDVKKVERQKGRRGFLLETSHGSFEANSVVVATGPFQCPIIPPIVPENTGILQIHSAAYRNPDQLPKGAVLIVGAGSSGVQIAQELLQAGRRIYLSVGPHERPPRAYRTRDYCWWLGVLGKWDLETRAPGREHITIAVSGARGGHTIDFRRLVADGMTLVGMTEAYKDGTVTFKRDLAENIAQGDANYLAVLDEADDYALRNGLNLPEEPAARLIGPDPGCMTHPVLSLNMVNAGVKTIVWATGYSSDYSWLMVDAFDEQGRPRHQRGVSSEAGIYFLGLPWQSRRGSAFIWGVWHDAKHLADHIARQRRYLEYHASANAAD